MDAANVSECDAMAITEGLCLAPKLLGRGTYGIVIKGTFHGLPVAVKIMTSQGLNRAALRELLLGPSLVHPNCVATYSSRCARLTHRFFDLLEGPRQSADEKVQPRQLQPVTYSGEGFGDPEGQGECGDPLPVLHSVLYTLQALTGQTLVLVVQEHCDKGTLADVIRKGVFQPTPTWSVRVARRALLRTATEVARGLLHLHEHGVVHGDIKPANVLLKNSRDDRRGFNAKVADIGLAHVLPVAATSMTSDSWGSVAYMSPEAFRGRVSRAGDIWSFSILLWEALMGERPYPHMEPGEVAAGVQSGRLRLKWPTLEPLAQPLVELGLRCMHTDPQERPSAKHIMQRLIQIEAAVRAQRVLPPMPLAPAPWSDPRGAGSQERARAEKRDGDEGGEGGEGGEGRAAAPAGGGGSDRQALHGAVVPDGPVAEAVPAGALEGGGAQG